MWTDLHSTCFCAAIEALLGGGKPGAVAFVRCLPPHVIENLSKDTAFAPPGWLVRRVADKPDASTRTVTADEAVEIRELKNQAVLLLVDVALAGAGMDGIYSAARELHERQLFKHAISIAASEVTRARSSEERRLAEQAVKKARGRGLQHSIPPWTEYDFLVKVASRGRYPGELWGKLGLWPARVEFIGNGTDAIDVSRRFVDRLLGPSVAGQTPAQRIAAIKLSKATNDQVIELEKFLRKAATIPLQEALDDLELQPNLWLGSLQPEDASSTIKSIEISPWFDDRRKLAKWSGLIRQADDEAPPKLVLDPDASQNGNYSHLEVRWRSNPDQLEKGSVIYRAAIVTDMNEDLASCEVLHSGKRDQKCRFSDDDFGTLNDRALVSANVFVSVIGSPEIVPQSTEEFQIGFGQHDERQATSAGKAVRCLSEGLIDLDDREAVSALAGSVERLATNSKGYLLLRTPQRGKSYRVFSPPLIREVEKNWAENQGTIGRWRVKVRASGARAASVEFISFDSSLASAPQLWERATASSRRMAERFSTRGGCGQVYDQSAKGFEAVFKEYMLAWAALLEASDPQLALANTVEVQTLSGRAIGLIVLPSHPLRVAWHVAYDNLVLHAKFEDALNAGDISKELALLDGAMFPAFLPGLSPGTTFVFADTLGFHAVGMVADSDKEPKAALAILARAIGDAEGGESSPTAGRQSAQVLGDEILKYVRTHNDSRYLQIHALRAGDGLTIARSLGHVQRTLQRVGDTESEDGSGNPGTAFVLELYPSEEQRVIAGRFIAETREKRRTGAGSLAEDDRWMLESLSLPGGISLPRLRWARKETTPASAAHLAVAFDTFESTVSADDEKQSRGRRPFYVYGLLTFFEREYSGFPSPAWQSRCLDSTDGEKHPADRSHTDRLSRLQQMIFSCVARNIGASAGLVLRSEITAEKGHHLKGLHHLCDWVITLDRNAGIEYFDSPRDNRDVYELYVIDCVPEREDLGCLQLITSTSNLEEVRRLLDAALDQMGLSQSRRNAEFLMTHLKALSGRLAIRLTGQKAPTSELIALAMAHAYARQGDDGCRCWPSLRDGFIIPIDDVQDILPPVQAPGTEAEAEPSRAVRPDLIYVRAAPKSGLQFRFIEVKYRRHLRDARSPELLKIVEQQVGGMSKRWDDWYLDARVAAPFRAVRRAKLARVLRFYAEKARRHADDDASQGLSAAAYRALITEVDRMVEKGAEYAFAGDREPNLGWIFCPEFASPKPLDISPGDWDTRMYLFGPQPLPDAPSVRATVDGSVRSPGDSGNKDAETPEETENGAINNTEARPEASEGSERSVEQNITTNGTEGQTEAKVILGKNLLTGDEAAWQMTIRGNPHLLVAGLPGMGKTACLLNMCGQMVTAGVRPIVFSYHEDIDHRLASLVPSIRFVDFQGLGFNPLKVIDRSSKLAYLDVAGTLRDIFVAIFPELGDIQGDRLRTAIKQSFIERGWDAPEASLGTAEEPTFKRFFEILQSDPKPDRGLRTLLARLGELADYGFFDLAGHHESLWDSEDPIVIRIHKTQNESLQNAFASLVLYKLYKDMFRRGTQTKITHSVIFDEAHRAARLSLIPTMAKECRKYGISLVLASQEARDFDESLFSAIANYLVLRVTEADAKFLVRNVSSSDQERSLIDKLKQMERFHALYFSERKKKPSFVKLAEPG